MPSGFHQLQCRPTGSVEHCSRTGIHLCEYVFRLAIVGKSGYMFKTISLIILAVAMMLGIDYVTGYRGWSLDFVVPSAILVVDLVIFLLILINRRNWQSYMMTEILTILLSLIPVILR